jgi:glycopeptide antibiotics resistance protein
MTQVARKVLWFIPLGGLLARGIALVSMRTPGRRPVLIGAGLLASLAVAVAIELVQILLPAKVADLTDILLHETGAIIGLVVMLGLHDYRARPAPAPE